MGVSKENIYSSYHKTLANQAKALGHPARIAIIETLLKSNNCACGTIVKEVGLAQSTTSQHLNVLQESGLVQSNQMGTSVCYSLVPEKWAELKTIMTKLMDQCCSSDCC